MRCSSLKATVTINRLGVTLIKSNATVEKRPCKAYCGHISLASDFSTIPPP